MSRAGVRILTTRTCRWTLRISVALREKGVPFELVNVLENGSKASWFLASTPFGKTPVLQHGERALPESLVICEYIEEAFAGRPLLSDEPMTRAWERVWLRFCDDVLIKGLYNIARSRDDIARIEAINSLLGEGRRLEDYRRASNPSLYWHGNQLTLPDMCFFTFFEALDRMDSGLRERFLTDCPSLARWREALLRCAVFSTASRELDTLAT